MLAIANIIISIISINLDLPKEVFYKMRGLEGVIFYYVWDGLANMILLYHSWLPISTWFKSDLA